jgi:hypothetical protein
MQYGQRLQGRFPNCEQFWRLFVVPATRRLETGVETFRGDIGYREGIDDRVQDLVEAHYSAFIHLAFAHLHVRSHGRSWLQNTAVRLASACDLAELFIERAYLLLLHCRGERPAVLAQLSEEDFVKLAAEWFRENYAGLYEHYLSKGKGKPILLPQRRHVVKEFYQRQGRPKLWSDYAKLTGPIREFRNRIVHNCRIARIIPRGSERNGYLVPKPEVIQNYPAWRDVFAVLKKKEQAEVIKREFVEPRYQLRSDLAALEEALNLLWEPVIEQFKAEFYGEARDTLRKMYAVDFGAQPSGPLVQGPPDQEHRSYDADRELRGTGGAASGTASTSDVHVNISISHIPSRRQSRKICQDDKD